MKGNQLRAHFRSDTQEWCTPRLLFAELDRRYQFTLDVCATHENAKCDRHYTKDDDGLSQPWAPSVCWMNPPYGREIGRWMRKAYEESQRGATVVCLVPARTDTAWWHDYAMRGRIQFLRGRLYFGDGAGRAPFPSALVVFVPEVRV